MISEARLAYLDRAAVEIAAGYASELIAIGFSPIRAALDAVELLAELLQEMRNA